MGKEHIATWSLWYYSYTGTCQKFHLIPAHSYTESRMWRTTIMKQFYPTLRNQQKTKCNRPSSMKFLSLNLQHIHTVSPQATTMKQEASSDSRTWRNIQEWKRESQYTWMHRHQLRQGRQQWVLTGLSSMIFSTQYSWKSRRTQVTGIVRKREK